MHRTRACLAFQFFLFFLFGVDAVAQPKLPGQWSISAFIGADRGVAASMRGTIPDFINQFESDYTNRDYPFGDRFAFNIGFGGHLAYRFPESPISLFLGTEINSFYVDDGTGLNEYNVSLGLWTWIFGAEYTLGLASERWNAFGRIGITGTTILGSINDALYYTTNISFAYRGGISAEAGGRYNVAFAPLAIELALDYTDANLIGKNYRQPQVLTNSNVLRDRALNDAANPNNPNDKTRIIDFLSLRIGGRIWL